MWPRGEIARQCQVDYMNAGIRQPHTLDFKCRRLCPDPCKQNRLRRQWTIAEKYLEASGDAQVAAGKFACLRLRKRRAEARADKRDPLAGSSRPRTLRKEVFLANGLAISVKGNQV